MAIELKPVPFKEGWEENDETDAAFFLAKFWDPELGGFFISESAERDPLTSAEDLPKAEEEWGRIISIRDVYHDYFRGSDLRWVYPDGEEGDQEFTRYEHYKARHNRRLVRFLLSLGWKPEESGYYLDEELSLREAPLD